MDPSQRRLRFAVGTTLLTASLSTGAVACKKDQPTANPGPEPVHVNEGPAPDVVEPQPAPEPEPEPTGELDAAPAEPDRVNTRPDDVEPPKTVNTQPTPE